MEKFIAERTKLAADMRAVLDVAKTEVRGLNADEKAKYDAMEARYTELSDMIKAEERAIKRDEEARNFKLPVQVADTPKADGFRAIADAMREKRAITIGGVGASSVVPEIFKAASAKYGLISKYRTFYGANASTVIPVLSPSLAVPAGQSEGATSVTSDSTAVFTPKQLLPKAYVSTLPVSAEAIRLSGVDFEAQLPGIFADAFARAIWAGSLTGAGTGNTMQGMFIDSALTTNVSCAASGAPKAIDLVNLALKAQDYADDAVLIVNPTFIASMMAEDGVDPIKAAYLATNKIMGVQVVASSVAPSTTTAGSVVAVAMPASNYAVAMASEISIKPKETVGDTNTYFEASVFMNGCVIVPANGFQLVTIS